MSSRRCSLGAAACALGTALVLATTPAGAAIRRAPTQAPANTVVDGPSAAILGLSGMAIARDGTGALVYLRNDTGAPHVFVSLLRNGVFAPPQQVDTGLSGPSSQPVIAVTNNGLTQIAFINAGTLYTVSSANVLTPFTAPVALAAGASNPSLSLSTYGKGYLAFTSVGSGGHDVRYAALISGQWTLASSALDQNPADDAGAGPARPRVVCAGDGTGIVTWGENGHIFTRRVLGITPSTTVLQADPSSFAGVAEVSADLPVVGAGGDSSYATVAFHETLGSGGARQSRVLVNRLHASRFDGVSGADNLTTPGAEGASSPAIAVAEYGDGLVTAAADTSHNLFATAVGSSQPGGSSQVNSLSQASAPDAFPATAGTVSTLIAWQQDSGGGAPAEIRIRYAPDGVDLNPEQVVSTPDLGSTNAAQGLAAGGDISGDAAVAWVQGSGASSRIVTAQLFQGPRGFAPAPAASSYARTAQPQFSWSPAGEQWGPLNYIVKVDGNPVGGTQATSLAPSAPLIQGRHTWQASATNLAGLTVVARPATVFVDSVAPKVTARVTGSHSLGATLRAAVTASDTPPLLPASDGSGVKTLTLNWGDRTRTVALGRLARPVHVYRRTGRYRLTITAIDLAGNRTRVTRTVTVKPKPRHKRSRRHAPMIRYARHGR